METKEPEVTVSVEIDKTKKEERMERHVKIFCLNDSNEREQFESIINDPKNVIERTEGHFTPDGKYFMAVFFGVKKEEN